MTGPPNFGRLMGMSRTIYSDERPGMFMPWAGFKPTFSKSSPHKLDCFEVILFLLLLREVVLEY